MKLVRSKAGLPCLWERGGSWSNTGSATIIAGADGEKLQAIYVRRREQLACEEHALIPIREGNIVISASHHRTDFDVVVRRIICIGASYDPDVIVMEDLMKFSMGEWDSDPAQFEAAIEAAKSKAMAYHCRSPYYVVAGEIFR